MSLETPLHRVEGLGSSHSGVSHFWRERVSGAALIPLGIWFAVSILGLAGGHYVSVLTFFSRPLNGILMAAFVVISLYHLVLGLQMVIDDYVHSPGGKVVLMLAARAFALACGALSLYALLEIARVF
ncbi:MAG: succinate dehydrogenase, hydrophobic membrane anchor protein [Alphaproteobacteria bacterium]|nr:succinate dehydrogenase, hydrophobic membrane anchor protein [Alphaproteobacteria bacterium]MBL7098618.1 succinate dehydrogenase, hydrophobic membrane anchor protein [Alphaproteobacteria bacterium]